MPHARANWPTIGTPADVSRDSTPRASSAALAEPIAKSSVTLRQVKFDIQPAINGEFMNGDQPISWLMFFTLAAGVVIVGGVFINFIRSRSQSRSRRGHAGRQRPRPRCGARTARCRNWSALGGVRADRDGPAGVRRQQHGPTETAQVQVAGQTTGGTTAWCSRRAEPAEAVSAGQSGDRPRVSPTGSNTGVGSSPGNTGTLTK